MKKSIFCAALLSVVSLAMSAQSEDARFSVSNVASMLNISEYDYHYYDLDNPKDEGYHTTRYLDRGVLNAYVNHMNTEIGAKESGELRGYSYNKIPTIFLETKGDVTEDYLNRINIGREIVEFWFSKKPGENSMSTDVVFERGEYAASDQDVLIANASQLGYAMVREKGWKLIDQSHLEVATLKKLALVEKKQTVEKTDYKTGAKYKETKISQIYSVTVERKLFKLVFDEQTRERVFNAWENDEEFNKIQFSLVQVKSNKSMYSSSNSFIDAISKIDEDYLTRLETIGQDLERKISVFSVNPISAKVGTKEGLYDYDGRYKTYKFKEDSKGNLRSKFVGYTRLATIARNEYKSTGNTKDLSTWVHIGGYPKIKPGMEMQRAYNNGNFGIAPYYGIGGLTTYGVTVDYALDWNLWHPSVYAGHYLLVDAGVTPTHFRKIGFYNLTVGYGFGLNLTRFIEIRPFVKVGMDILGGINKPIRSAYTHYSSLSKNYVRDGVVQFVAIGGGDLNFQIMYPVYLFVRADYSVAVGKSQLYKDIHFYDNNHGPGGIMNHGNGLGLKAGLRVVL